jgi:hypothetical protein
MKSENKSPPNIENKDTSNNQKKEESKELIQNDNANIINNGHIIQQSSKEISSLEKNNNISNPNKQNEIKNYNINNNSSSSLNILENKLLLNSINNINQKNNCQHTNSIINNTISIFNQSNQYNINNVDNNKNVNNNLEESNPNNDDNAIYLIDSEDEKEINNSQNKTNDNNNGNTNDINNISNNNSYKLDKMLLNSVDNNMEKKEYLKNNSITGEKKIQNSNNVPQLNTNTSNNVNNNIISNNENKKDEKLDNKKNSPTKQIEKKLYYRRKLNSYKRKYKGKEELNLQVFIANYGQKEIFPSFIFGSKQFFYYPRNYRHITPNGKGYIISFPGLKKLFNEKLIKKDLENMCTYYFKQKRGRQNSLDIKVKDEKTLNDGVFLNDGIVNFYLKIIEDEYTCGEGQTNNVLIQKSFFYNSLSNQQNPDLSNNFCYPDSCSFIRTKINVFSFKTLIIPICEHYHWSLIIVNDIDKMGNLFTEKNLKEYYSNNYNLNDDDQSEYPEFFYLDSLYNINYRRMIIILKYLFYEYQKIYSVKCDMADFFMKNFRKIECYNPEVPKQDNSYDCGIFLLIYAELFLYNPNYFLKIVSKKYKINHENEINNKNISIENINTKSVTNNLIINNNNIINNINITNNANNTNIILKNIISPQSEIKNINYINIEVSHNIINNENINSNNIIRNNINSLNINENQMKNNNLNNDSNKIKNIEISIKNDENKETIKNTNSKESINNIDSNINNELENALDKIDIEIEENNNNNLTENNDNSDVKKPEVNNEQNDNNSSALNNDMKNAVNEVSLRNWFSLELVNNQRNKIKKLINELSKIEKEITDKNDIDGIRKEQNSVIKKYMEMQKKEFDDYFSKLKD